MNIFKMNHHFKDIHNLKRIHVSTYDKISCHNKNHIGIAA